MKILLLCTYFYPDSVIAATRPTLFTKYLTDLGHDVTVICSGKIHGSLWSEDMFDAMPIQQFFYTSNPKDFELSVAKNNKQQSKKHASWWKQSSLRKFRNTLKEPLSFYKKGYLKFKKIKKIIDDELQNEHFDVIFATYGNLETLYAGAYAKKKLQCPLIFDFRDPIVSIASSSFRNFFAKFTEKKFYSIADINTTISDGVANSIKKYSDKPIYCLSNGYYTTEKKNTYAHNKHLSLVYTGMLYTGLSNITPLIAAIDSLTSDNINYQLKYAGSHFDELQKQIASIKSAQKNIIDCGQLSRKESYQLQDEADLFIVLTWNTKTYQGVRTGKFYEALRAGKPIVGVVSGDTKNSELRMLIEKYNLGVCYEEADHEATYPLLVEYLKKQALRKQEGLEVLYDPSPEVFKAFNYKNITDELVKIMNTIV